MMRQLDHCSIRRTLLFLIAILASAIGPMVHAQERQAPCPTRIVNVQLGLRSLKVNTAYASMDLVSPQSYLPIDCSRTNYVARSLMLHYVPVRIDGSPVPLKPDHIKPYFRLIDFLPNSPHRGRTTFMLDLIQIDPAVIEAAQHAAGEGPAYIPHPFRDTLFYVMPKRFNSHFTGAPHDGEPIAWACHLSILRECKSSFRYDDNTQVIYRLRYDDISIDHAPLIHGQIVRMLTSSQIP